MFQKQLMMRRVLYALFPIFAFSLYLYGWRPLIYMAMALSLSVATEFFFLRLQKRKDKVSEAALVTGALYALSMPPLLPFWMSAVGILFGIFIGKMAFGGFGRNIFNPAIVGRLFVYLTFPSYLTTESWLAPGEGWRLKLEALTSATPLNEGGVAGSEFLRYLLGLRPGSIGESAVFLIIAAAIYLAVTKTASWRIMVSSILSFLLVSSLFYYVFDITDTSPIGALLLGSFLFVSILMATDPVTAPKNKKAHWVFGFIVGTTSYLIRTLGPFPEGTSFGVLLGNTVAPLFDDSFTLLKKRRMLKREE